MAVQYWKNKGENKTRFVLWMVPTMAKLLVPCLPEQEVFLGPFSDLLFECTHIPFPKDEQAAIQNLKTEIDKGGIAAFILNLWFKGLRNENVQSSNTKQAHANM